MISHDHKIVQIKMPPILITYRYDHHLCDLWHSQVERASTSIVKQTIHGQECLAMGSRLRKASIVRQAAMQTPCQKDRLPNGMIMGQAANMESSHRE